MLQYEYFPIALCASSIYCTEYNEDDIFGINSSFLQIFFQSLRCHKEDPTLTVKLAPLFVFTRAVQVDDFVHVNVMNHRKRIELLGGQRLCRGQKENLSGREPLVIIVDYVGRYVGLAESCRKAHERVVQKYRFCYLKLIASKVRRGNVIPEVFRK